MGFFDWIGSKIISDKTLDSLIEKALDRGTPIIKERLHSYVKDEIQNVLEDEEIAAGLIQYTDAIYARYQKKFFGAIGGTQKGINATTEGLNPLSQIVDEDGNFSLSRILGLAMSGGLKQLGANAPKQTTAEFISKY